MISNAALSFSIVAGLMSIMLFLFGAFLEKNKKKSKTILIWAMLFLISSFAGLEWAFWLEGQNMFELLAKFTFPLILYFVIWLAFIIWLFESRGERKIWATFLIALAIMVLIAVNCMNCIQL